MAVEQPALIPEAISTARSWLDLFLMVISGGIGAGAATIGWEFWQRRHSRNEDVRHLALNVAVVLEGYAIEVSHKLGDHQLANDSAGAAGNFIASIPVPPPFPESTHYRLMTPSLLDRILDFPQRCKMADLEVQFWWEAVGEIDDVRASAYKGAAKMGALAVSLSSEIRTQYDLPARELSFGDWDIVTGLRDA